MGEYRDKLAAFTITSMPDLDVVVLGALELMVEQPGKTLHDLPFQRLLVLGSGNAFQMAKIIFADQAAVFADESVFTEALTNKDHYDGVIVVSASGQKHAIAMVEQSLATGLSTVLVTNSPDSPAAALLPAPSVHAFPKNREPYTYNTSTYLGPILSGSGEDPRAIMQHIETVVSPKLLRNFGDFNAFTLLIPSRFEPVREMLRTKFDELFGGMLTGRVFTDEEVKHAKTVVRSGAELFISFGVENDYYGLTKNRLFIPLPEQTGPGALIAVSYFVVGKIQAAMPPYFKENIVAYCETASKIFGQELKPIVE